MSETQKVHQKEHTIIGSTSLPQSFTITLTVKGLRELIQDMDDEDAVRITTGHVESNYYHEFERILK